ncbi:hypothetical protein [Stomatohabitans albus]|uniref:hypothetical protein n=1 Tax=Stomatohabitans albus TaxID=3110766 RepID=UPI00300D9CD1
MTDEPDKLHSRVDEAFEAAVNQQLAEQREIRRLVSRVEESVSQLTGGFSDLTDTLDRSGEALQTGVSKQLSSIDGDLRTAIEQLEQAASQSSSSLEQAVERLYAVAAQARDTNGSVLGDAVEDMRRVLSDGHASTRSSIDRLSDRLEQNRSKLSDDVREVLSGVRTALDNQAENYAVRLATTVVEIREQLEATSQRDETLLRQAIGAIENRMDYGRTQVAEQLSAAHTALSDELALERSNRETLIERLDQALAHLRADRDKQRAEFKALSAEVGERLDVAVQATGVQWRDAVSALERATDGLHDDRDAGRAELANSLAALTGVTDTSTRRIDQLNAMIDMLQSSADGIAPVLEEAVTALHTRVGEQLADQRAHTNAVVERIETAQDRALTAALGKLDEAAASFSGSAHEIIASEQAQLETALTALNAAANELYRANGGFVEDWDIRTQQVANTLAKSSARLIEIAESAGSKIVGEVRSATGDLVTSQTQALELSNQARSSLVDTQRVLGQYLSQFEPAVTGAIETLHAKVDESLTAMNGDVRENALSVSAQMRDSAADIRQQLSEMIDVARTEVRKISDEATQVNQHDRDRLERTMTELNDASATVRATMEHLVAEARKEMATVRVDTLAQLDTAVRDVERMGQTLPGKVAEAAKSYEVALTTSAEEITTLTRNVDLALNQRLERIEHTTLDLNESSDRMQDIVLDQVSRLRASVETASQSFVQTTEEQTGAYRRDLAGALDVVKEAMAQRLDEAAKHLAARTTDVQEANNRGANRIEAVGAQLVASIEQIQPQVDATVHQLSAVLTAAAAEERTRSDANLDRLTGAVNQRMASLDGALNDLAARLGEIEEDTKVAQASVVADFAAKLGAAQHDVTTALAASSQNVIEATGSLIDDQLRAGLAELVKTLNETKNFSATHHGATQQAMTEAEAAYRNATNRLEEVVDASRREIERAISQTADQLERRTGAMGSALRDDIGGAVTDALTKAGDQFTRQVETLSNREDKGVTRLAAAADALTTALAGVEERVDLSLERLHSERPDPLPSLIAKIADFQDELRVRESQLAESHLGRLDDIEGKLTTIVNRVEADLRERMGELVVRVDDAVANRIDQAMATMEERLVAQMDTALRRRSESEQVVAKELENLAEKVGGEMADRVTELRAEATTHLRRMADQHHVVTQAVADRIGQSSADMERKVGDIQGAQVARLEAVAGELKAIAHSDRSEDRRRVDDLVSTIGRHVAELTVALNTVEGLDDRVASRVSRSLTELRNSLIDEVRSVSREASTIRPGQQIFSPTSVTQSGRSTSRASDGAVVPLAKSSSSSGKRSRPAPPDRREPAQANTTCPYCGFVARTAVGLATHIRSCEKR